MRQNYSNNRTAAVAAAAAAAAAANGGSGRGSAAIGAPLTQSLFRSFIPPYYVCVKFCVARMSVKNLNAFSEGYTLTNWDLERLLPTETADLVVRPPLPWNRILDRVKETLLNNTTSRKRSYPRTHCIIASATRHGLHWYVALFNCQEMRARLVEPTASLEWSILLANELKAIGFEVAVSALSEQKENDNWRCGYVCLHVVRTICKAPKKWMQVEIPPLPQDSEASVWAALRRFELEERAEEEAKARAADRELRAKREERLRQHLHRQKEKKEKEAQVAEPTADAAGPEGAAAESGAQEGTVAPAEETDLPLLDEAAAAASPPRRSPTAFDGVSDALGTEDLAYNNPSSSTGGTPAPPPGSAAGGTPLPSPSPAKIGDGAPGRDLSDDAWLSVGSARQPGKAAQGAGDGDIFADLDGDLLMGGLEGEAAAGQAVAAAGAPPLKRKVPDEYDWLYDEDETKKAKREEAKDEVWLFRGRQGKREGCI